MIKSLNTAATGMIAQQTNMDVIANNIANVNTTGFKKGRAEFEDLIYHNLKDPGQASGLQSVTPTGVQTGLGVRTSAVQKDFSLGSVAITKNPLDMHIEGGGFFQVRTPDGEIAYTRDGAFKKDAIIAAGGFTTDTLAEDCDITIRILKAGYTIANEPNAIAYTEAPETLKQFIKQRNRWSFGVMQTFWKHKDLLFNTTQKNLGFIALPDMLLFKYIIPFFMPLADVLMIVGLITDNAGQIGLYYLIFTLIDTAIAAIAFAFDKENPLKLIWLIPQRLIYRWLMMVILFKALRRAIKGELQHWGVLKRTGNVKEVLN